MDFYREIIQLWTHLPQWLPFWRLRLHLGTKLSEFSPSKLNFWFLIFVIFRFWFRILYTSNCSALTSFASVSPRCVHFSRFRFCFLKYYRENPGKKVKVNCPGFIKVQYSWSYGKCLKRWFYSKSYIIHDEDSMVQKVELFIVKLCCANTW